MSTIVRVAAPEARLLLAQQRRVAAVLTDLPDAGWQARLGRRARRALVATGHFPEYTGELDWTPLQVAGHLRDSARVFTDRLRRLLGGDPTPLADFDPLAPARVAGYAAVPRAVLLSGLHDAQLTLHATVAAVTPPDRDRTGLRDSGEPVTVAELLRFLPAHQADHAAQLEALTGRS
ncbi:DinB family protein [Geodermatophilus sp. URMC 64]